MGTPHKHAEIIKAWADGAEIEQKRNDFEIWEKFDGEWSDSKAWEFRIKPEPKPDAVRYVGLDTELDGDAAYIVDEEYLVSHWHSILKITLDGETGKLKSAEVLK